MLERSRVEWSEVRAAGTERAELFFLIAERDQDRWKFFERSSWEVRWYEIPASQSGRLSNDLQKIGNKQ